MSDGPWDDPAPNRNALWGRLIVEELARAGVTAACIAPGSRSTPLVVALASHPAIETFSHLDERSAAFFALGRGKRTHRPCAIVTTSGTAVANLHPAIIEADRGRVPMLALTADRPPELHDSGANQTIDQRNLFGGAVRWFRDLPEPAAQGRRMRAVRTAVSRAVGLATGPPAGPVHVNVPFAKPLEPTQGPGAVPADLADRCPKAATGRSGPFVAPDAGVRGPSSDRIDGVCNLIEEANRGLIVCGPTDRDIAAPLVSLARATGFPILADPLSGLRFGPHVSDPTVTVLGGYDSWLDHIDTDGWDAAPIVLRFGANPTSSTLQAHLGGIETHTVIVDPAGDWREASFPGGELLRADPGRFATQIVDTLGAGHADANWRRRLGAIDGEYWSVVADSEEYFEGGIVADTVHHAPDPSTIVISNSMPIRDADRFARPHSSQTRVLGNRGASGIDGIPSTALGAESACDDPTVLILGDLALYHDMNGLLAVDRFELTPTIVAINNDGGGIFHMLPIEEYDPPFTEHFKTPHDLDFTHVADLYGLEHVRVTDREAFRAAYRAALGNPAPVLLEAMIDAEKSHRTREQLHDAVGSTLEFDP